MNPHLTEHERHSLQKPSKGSGYLAGKDRRADRKQAEDKEMAATRKRDGNRCRWHGCNGKYRGLDLPIDVAHESHRGMGGNAKLDRTTTAGLICLCRRHHAQWDDTLIDIQPITSAGFNDRVMFLERDRETGGWRHVGSETHMGVSEVRRG